MSQNADEAAPRTQGATRAGAGEYLFDLGTVAKIMGGPAYSTAQGPCVEGDRMMVAVMRMKAGTGAEKETTFETWPATMTCTDEEPPVPLPLAFGSSTVAMMELSE